MNQAKSVQFSMKWFSAGLLAGGLIALTVFFAIKATNKHGFRLFDSSANHYYLPMGASVDRFGRMASWPGKKHVPCPSQKKKTAVLLILGQSNAGNHAGMRNQSLHGSNVVNYYEGICTEAGSPLLGATGQGGEPWTIIADRLIERGEAANVVLVPIAISGTSIASWLPDGDLGRLLRKTLSDMQSSSYQPTHVLWTQGEADFARRTSTEYYFAAFSTLVQSLRDVRVQSPVYVTIASKCAGQPSWQADNPVVKAQHLAINLIKGVRSGPNMDSLLLIGDRFDGCHLSQQGLMKLASGWIEILSSK